MPPTVQRKILHEETLSAGGIFSVSFPTNYDHIVINAMLRTSSADQNDFVNIYFNGDTTNANYESEIQRLHNGAYQNYTSNAEPKIEVVGNGSNFVGNSYIHAIIMFYSGNKYKNMLTKYGVPYAINFFYIGSSGIAWQSTSKISSLVIQPDGYPTDSLMAGSYLQVIGVK